MSFELSIVIPIFNEEQAILPLFRALNRLKTQLPAKTEVILVNDGSRDQTLRELQKQQLHFTKVVLNLSRNFGHQAALFAGLEAAQGRVVITMDGDLQHPPTLIPQMLQLHNQGYEVVLTQRIDTQTVSFFKKITARIFYLLMKQVSDTTITLNASDFRSLSRKALQALLAMPERRKFLRGMVSWIGFESIILPYQVQDRVAGESKYSVSKMLTLAFHGITSFSTLPLYLAGIFSFLFFSSAFAYAMYVLIVRFVLGNAVSGWASVQFVLLALGGFLSLFLGLLGVYLAAVYEELKQRPLYILSQTQTTIPSKKPNARRAKS